MKAMKEIKFASTLSMDHPHLVAGALADCMDVPVGERFVVDLTDLQKISAFGVAALGARMAGLVRAKRMPTGTVVRRPESGRVSNDLMRMGLYSLLQDASVGVYQKDMDQRPQELWLVDDPADLPNACARLINLLRTVFPSSDQNFERMQEMLGGLADNIFRHAKSPTGAMLCAQCFPKAGVVEFAVADTGQGVAASLRRFPHLASALSSNAQAILTALTLKVGSADGSNRPGFLNTLVATARKVQGEFVCLSGGAAISLKNGELRTTEVDAFGGTLVGVRLKLFGKDE